MGRILVFQRGGTGCSSAERHTEVFAGLKVYQLEGSGNIGTIDFQNLNYIKTEKIRSVHTLHTHWKEERPLLGSEGEVEAAQNS